MNRIRITILFFIILALSTDVKIQTPESKQTKTAQKTKARTKVFKANNQINRTLTVISIGQNKEPLMAGTKKQESHTYQGIGFTKKNPLKKFTIVCSTAMNFNKPNPNCPKAIKKIIVTCSSSKLRKPITKTKTLNNQGKATVNTNCYGQNLALTIKFDLNKKVPDTEFSLVLASSNNFTLRGQELIPIFDIESDSLTRSSLVTILFTHWKGKTNCKQPPRFGSVACEDLLDLTHEDECINKSLNHKECDEMKREHEQHLCHWSYVMAAKKWITNPKKEKCKPFTYMTKGQVAIALAKVLKLKLPSKKSVFKDVPTSHPAFTSIKALHQRKLIKGNKNGNFHPDETATYAWASKLAKKARKWQRINP